MGTYEQLKAAITAAIKSNGNQEITGAILQGILLSIVNTIGSGAVFKGVATPTTNPGNRDENCFYLAGTAGTYSNFGGFALNEGLAVLQNSNGSWVGTKILSIALKADTDNIGGSHRLKYNQTAMINLYNVEPISACTENNKLWFKTDGHLYYRQAGVDYDLNTPAYLLYYNGTKIYKWNGSGFTEMSSGGGEPVSLDFKTGESVEDISLFGSKESLDNKSDAQLALMVPTGAIIKVLLDMIDSIDTSGGSYDGIDQVVTFSFTASTRILTLKQSGRTAKTITLPLASTSSPGLMSAQDKTDLNNAKNKIVTGISYTETDGNLVITLTSADNTTKSVTLPTKLKANLVGNAGNLILSLKEWPRCVIRNIAYEGFDYSSVEVGDVYYDENATAPYKRLYYKATLEGNPINLGLPQEKVIYYCETTRKFYKFVANSRKTDGQFVEISQSGGSSGSVVDDLDTGGSNVPLSAEQGKNLKIALESLRTALANLAFEGNVPTFPWDSETPEGDISNYVQDRLVFHLDGINKGNNADAWTDLIGGVVFPNHGATAEENGFLFEGTGWLGVKDESGAEDLDFDPSTITIEAAYRDDSTAAEGFAVCTFGTQTSAAGKPALLMNKAYNAKYINGMYLQGTQNVWSDPLIDGAVAAHTISVSAARAFDNANQLSSLGVNHWSTNKGGRFVGATHAANGAIAGFAVGKIFSIRVYNRQLSETEVRHNQRVDNARFNLGLTIPEAE